MQESGEAALWISHDPDDWKRYEHVME
jgi:hypothetical protein